MTGPLYCYRCKAFRNFTDDCRCGLCGYVDSGYAAIQARTTVGSSFIAPEPDDEALALRIAAFLNGRIDDADNVARNLATVLICEFDIKPRQRT